MPENLVPPQDPGDPFDPARLRLSQDFTSMIGVKKQLLTVPVRKPDRQTFVRTHPDPSYRLETAVIDLKEDRETYLVGSEVREALGQDIVPMVLVTTINRQGVLTIWPIRLPDSQGRHNPWHQSALEAANLARTIWVKLVANQSLRAYDIFTAEGNLADPEWPELSFHEILRLAFKDKYINSVDHPVCRQLRGET